MKRLRLIALAFGFCLAVGLPLAAMAGPTPGGTDTDGDGVEDAFDNCTLRKNPTQVDTDHDGCGQFCDFDWNNSGLVQLSEYNKAAKQAGDPICATPPGPPFNNCVCDFDQNGVCTTAELNQINKTVGLKPGTSGITNAVCDPALCQCTPAP